MHQNTYSIGDPALIRTKPLALFCSGRCPGGLILRTYDLARALRDKGVTVIGGFHSAIEKDCLDILLKGKQPVIVCPARGIEGMRLPAAWKTPLADGRLLVLSPFPKRHRRATAALAEKRNEFAASLAERVFVAHAAPGSKTEALCRKVLSMGKPLLTFDAKENAHLMALGAKPLDLSSR